MFRILIAGLALAVHGASAMAQDDGPALTQLTPEPRPADLSAISPRQAELDRWLSAFRGRALVQGISRDTVDAALDGLAYDSTALSRARTRDETGPVWTYLDRVVSDARISDGQAALDRQARILDAISARYGVDKAVLAAVWGIESGYGTERGTLDLIPALATLAAEGPRGRYYEAQLVAALRILEAGDVERAALRGSATGAMGHTGMIPSTYLVDAVDFDGDGRRDIWGENPADALASTAAFLSRHGWVSDMPWAVEVTLPDDLDFAVARESRRLPSDWAEMGIVAASGEEISDYGPARLVLPAGGRGVALLVFENYDVLARLSTTEPHAIAVGHLADRLTGGAPFEAEWPRGDRTLDEDETSELQRLLTATGFDTQGVDGTAGPLTRAAIRAYQRAAGLVPDGYPSLFVLESLRDG